QRLPRVQADRLARGRRLRDGSPARARGGQNRSRAIHRLRIRRRHRQARHASLRGERPATVLRERSALSRAIRRVLSMKVPYRWLTEWVPVPWEARELGDRLSMAGFEVESLEPAAPPFSGVVVAEILDAAPHPQADKLRVCRVATGSGSGGGQGLAPLQIVCGASNARAGLKCALARVGAVLPGNVVIEATRIRGIESQGMLCSAKELSLADSSAGIIELPSDAPLGKPLREYFELDDVVLDLNVTPNRGDALSVLGIAREVSTL